jgi:hypothetical protein
LQRLHHRYLRDLTYGSEGLRALPEPFSHEDRMEAGETILSFFDALEDQDLQDAILAVRHAVEKAQQLLVDRGMDDHTASLLLIGPALGPLLKPED